jgi:4'-phosphopantetheinyl transferase
MTRHYLEKIPIFFTPSEIPNAAPVKQECVMVIADIAKIPAIKLPFEELFHAEGMRAIEARKRYLAGRYLLRGILAQWSSIASSDLPIVLNSSGKPMILAETMPHFSISHTGCLVAVAFSLEAIGIDLEQERPLDYCALARRFFSQEEALALENSGSLHQFFRLWCSREAAIKGDGRGLGTLLSETQVQPSQTMDSNQIFVMIEEAIWSVIPWMMRDSIHGAVAFRAMPRVIRWCDLR